MATVLPPTKSGLRDRTLTEERRIGPFRGQLLGAEGLAAHARAVALRQRVADAPSRRAAHLRSKVVAGPLLGRLDDTERLLEETRATLTDAADRGVDVSSAGDWLLDNFYVVQEHIIEIRQNLPRSYYAELPKLAEGPLAGYPRIYELAIELIAHTEGHLDLENIGLFVREFQNAAPLNMGELWAVAIMLRLGLVENIRRLALRVIHRLQEVESADHWAERLQDASRQSPKALTDALSAFVDGHPPLTPVFVARLFQQIRGYQAEFRKLLWLEQWIAEEALTAEDAVTRSNQRLALTQVMMANHLTSLRRISRLDWDAFFEAQSETEAILRRDPAAFYARMTFQTRDRYRHVVEDVARGADGHEADVARRAIELAQAHAAAGGREAHVGYYLIDAGRSALEQAVDYEAGFRESLYRLSHRHPNFTYFGGAMVVGAALVAALLLALASAPGWVQAVLLVLAFVPISELAVGTVNQLLTLLLPPSHLPKLEFRESGITPEFRTVVAVPTLFPSVRVVREQLAHLEVQFLANRQPNLHFAILSDFTDAPAQHAEGDDEILAAAVEGIAALNRTYGEGAEHTFYLLHRSRQWNPRQGVWMGWERKRGKLAQFNALIQRGERDPFSTIVGDLTPLHDARYVITLDSDSTLPHDAAALLAGTLAHPLNRGEYDPAAGRVVRGYGILQPRVGVALTSASRTLFAAIHSGHPGVDPYTTAVSDVYQDLYGEGSFTGKGIYDVDIFRRATAGRFPDDAVLSHDLIEGAFARAALLTDVQLFDDYPATYLTHARRKHRWIRGDWQLMPWLRKRVPGPGGRTLNPLSTVSRWKIFDNLRRSLVEPTQLALLIACWALLPGAAAVWTGVVLVAIAWPWMLGLLLAVVRPPRDKSWRGYYGAVGRDAITSAQQVALTCAFLPHQAAIAMDAIARTIYRVLISRRHLLEWLSASQVERREAGVSRSTWRRMASALVIAVLALALAAWRGALPPALPLALLWLASPAIAQLLLRPPAQREIRLTPAERTAALRLALVHWRFFETFVTETTQGLAPDNFQESPEPVIARRTSPTNIGLQLLSIVTARDLGFIGTGPMIERLEQVFRALERMRRYRGHFFNWYDLSDLHVLDPAYISTVDSGNFAGHLIALKQACLAPTAAAPPTRAAVCDAIRAAVRLALGPPVTAAEPHLEAALAELSAPDARADDLAALLIRLRPHLAAAADADDGWWTRWARDAVEARLAELETAAGDAEGHIARLAVLARRAHEYATGMDFTMLFDERRKLFSIGYQEVGASLDSSFYDLLASEARLASYFAISKDDVPPEHWFRLGRNLTVEGGDTALVSWSGSMFEYLMPLLVMRSLPFTLLDQTHHSAVRRQIAYGREHGVPWGASESAYNVRDRHGTYQYRAFGVPDLGLKRGLAKELVIAPYATLLAIQVMPKEAMQNLTVLEREGALGPYGFRDAIDYTHTAPDTPREVVGTYMAHHIGMGLVALCNALSSQSWQRHFHADPLTRSAELLLGERIPRRYVAQETQADSITETPERGERERPAVREYDTADTRQPQVALLGTMPYTVMITNAGAGSSRYEHLAVTRWRADPTRDDTGQWCYIRDLTDNRVWSAAHQPVCRIADSYRAVFAADRVSFHRRDGDIETLMEIAVVPDDRAEVRRVTLTNRSRTERTLEVTSYGEIVLHPPRRTARIPRSATCSSRPSGSPPTTRFLPAAGRVTRRRLGSGAPTWRRSSGGPSRR